MNLFNYNTYEEDIKNTHKYLKSLSIPNCENTTQDKTLFDFILNLIDAYTTYKNENGNCALCSLCDYVNILYNNGLAKYKPVKRTIQNNYLYNKIANFTWWDANFSLKENQIFSLNELIKTNLNCIISVACKGGYHSLAYINGLFYNNWNNRKGLTLEELKKDFNYSKTPKLIQIKTNNKILSTLEKAIQLGLIIQ